MNQISFTGQKLRERRMEMGMRLEDVYLKTRIPQAYVEHLEKGELDSLPSPCYTVGFLRSYCSFLGLDAEPFLRSYHISVQPVQRSFFNRGITIPSNDRRMKRFSDMLTWAAVCAIIALAWFAYSVVIQPNQSVTDKRVEATTIHLNAPPVPQLPDRPHH